MDEDSREVAGYARWVLPPELGARNGDDGEGVWSDARVPEPTEEEAREFEWSFRENTTPDGGVLGLRTDAIMEFRSRPLEEADERVRAQRKGPFISMYHPIISHPPHRTCLSPG